MYKKNTKFILTVRYCLLSEKSEIETSPKVASRKFGNRKEKNVERRESEFEPTSAMDNINKNFPI